MTNAVTYAYTTTTEERPSLLDQFYACRAYAAERGYTIVGEFNDIDEADHKATGAALESTRNAIANDGATVVLVYQPKRDVEDSLHALGATVETVTTR